MQRRNTHRAQNFPPRLVPTHAPGSYLQPPFRIASLPAGCLYSQQECYPPMYYRLPYSPYPRYAPYSGMIAPGVEYYRVITPSGIYTQPANLPYQNLQLSSAATCQPLSRFPGFRHRSVFQNRNDFPRPMQYNPGNTANYEILLPPIAPENRTGSIYSNANHFTYGQSIKNRYRRCSVQKNQHNRSKSRARYPVNIGRTRYRKRRNSSKSKFSSSSRNASCRASDLSSVTNIEIDEENDGYETCDEIEFLGCEEMDEEVIENCELLTNTQSRGASHSTHMTTREDKREDDCLHDCPDMTNGIQPRYKPDIQNHHDGSNKRGYKAENTSTSSVVSTQTRKAISAAKVHVSNKKRKPTTLESSCEVSILQMSNDEVYYLVKPKPNCKHLHDASTFNAFQRQVEPLICNPLGVGKELCNKCQLLKEQCRCAPNSKDNNNDDKTWKADKGDNTNLIISNLNVSSANFPSIVDANSVRHYEDAIYMLEDDSNNEHFSEKSREMWWDNSTDVGWVNGLISAAPSHLLQSKPTSQASQFLYNHSTDPATADTISVNCSKEGACKKPTNNAHVDNAFKIMHSTLTSYCEDKISKFKQNEPLDRQSSIKDTVSDSKEVYLNRHFDDKKTNLTNEKNGRSLTALDRVAESEKTNKLKTEHSNSKDANHMTSFKKIAPVGSSLQQDDDAIVAVVKKNCTESNKPPFQYNSGLCKNAVKSVEVECNYTLSQSSHPTGDYEQNQVDTKNDLKRFYDIPCSSINLMTNRDSLNTRSKLKLDLPPSYDQKKCFPFCKPFQGTESTFLLTPSSSNLKNAISNTKVLVEGDDTERHFNGKLSNVNDFSLVETKLDGFSKSSLKTTDAENTNLTVNQKMSFSGKKGNTQAQLSKNKSSIPRRNSKSFKNKTMNVYDFSCKTTHSEYIIPSNASSNTITPATTPEIAEKTLQSENLGSKTGEVVKLKKQKTKNTKKSLSSQSRELNIPNSKELQLPSSCSIATDHPLALQTSVAQTMKSTLVSSRRSPCVFHDSSVENQSGTKNFSAIFPNAQVEAGKEFLKSKQLPANDRSKTAKNCDKLGDSKSLTKPDRLPIDCLPHMTSKITFAAPTPTHSPMVTSKESESEYMQGKMHGKIKTPLRTIVHNLFSKSIYHKKNLPSSPCLAALQATSNTFSKLALIPESPLNSGSSLILSSAKAMTAPSSPTHNSVLENTQRSMSLSDVFYDSTIEESILLNSACARFKQADSSISKKNDKKSHKQRSSSTYVSFSPPTLTPKDKAVFRQSDINKETEEGKDNLEGKDQIEPTTSNATDFGNSSNIQSVSVQSIPINCSTDNLPDRSSYRSVRVLEKNVEDEIYRSAEMLFKSVNSAQNEGSVLLSAAHDQNHNTLKFSTSEVETSTKNDASKTLLDVLKKTDQSESHINDPSKLSDTFEEVSADSCLVVKVNKSSKCHSLIHPKKPPRSKAPRNLNVLPQNVSNQGNIGKVNAECKQSIQESGNALAQIVQTCQPTNVVPNAVPRALFPSMGMSSSRQSPYLSPTLIALNLPPHVSRNPQVVNFVWPNTMSDIENKSLQISLSGLSSLEQSSEKLCDDIKEANSEITDSSSLPNLLPEDCSKNQTSNSAAASKSIISSSLSVSNEHRFCHGQPLFPLHSRASLFKNNSKCNRRRSFSGLRSSTMANARLNHFFVPPVLKRPLQLYIPAQFHNINYSYPLTKHIAKRRPRFVRSSLSDDTVLETVKENGHPVFMTKPGNKKVLKQQIREVAVEKNRKNTLHDNDIESKPMKIEDTGSETGYSSSEAVPTKITQSLTIPDDRIKDTSKNLKAISETDIQFDAERNENINGETTDGTCSESTRKHADSSKDKKKMQKVTRIQRLRKYMSARKIFRQDNVKDSSTSVKLFRSKTEPRLPGRLDASNQRANKDHFRAMFLKTKRNLFDKKEDSTLKAIDQSESSSKETSEAVEKMKSRPAMQTDRQIYELKGALFKPSFVVIATAEINCSKNTPAVNQDAEPVELTDCTAATICHHSNNQSVSTPGVRINSETGDVIEDKEFSKTQPRACALLSSTAIEEGISNSQTESTTLPLVDTTSAESFDVNCGKKNLSDRKIFV